MESSLVEVLAHERALMLAIVAYLPFPSLVRCIVCSVYQTLNFSSIIQYTGMLHTQCSTFQLYSLRLPWRAPARKFTNSSLHMVFFNFLSSYGGFNFHLQNSKASQSVAVLPKRSCIVKILNPRCVEGGV